MLAVGTVYAMVSDVLTLGPRIFLLGFVAVLVVPLMGAHAQGRHDLARGLGVVLTAVVTVAVAASAVLLVYTVLGRGTSASMLLLDAALIWVMNILTFAVWYWEIDGGGPARRYAAYASEDFLFPQISLGGETHRDWSPNFVDYLFLAFNTSTAFSPTDTPVLSRRAKVLTMVQALLSLMVITVLVSRAVNALAGGQRLIPR